MIKTITLPIGGEFDTIKLLLSLGACPSRAEAKRLVEQSAVDVDGENVGLTFKKTEDFIIHCGKHFWREVVLPRKTFRVETNGRDYAKIIGVV